MLNCGLAQPTWGAVKEICKMSWQMSVLYGLFVEPSCGRVWLGVGDWVSNRSVKVPLFTFTFTFTSVALPAICML